MPNVRKAAMNRDHVTVHHVHGTKVALVYCGHCTGTIVVTYPIRVGDMVQALEAFVQRHGACKEESAK